MKKSFTIIELIIVVAITIVLTGVGLASYNSFTQDKKLDTDVQKFIDVVELAKKKAQSGDASLCASANPAITPRVEKYSIVATANSYQLVPNCTSGATPNSITFQVDSSTQLQGGPLYPTVDLKPLSSITVPGCFIFKNTDSSKCKYINVESTGNVCSGSCTCASCSCSSC